MTKRTQQERDDIRRVLLFLRVANKLRELITKYPLEVKIELTFTRVQPANPLQRAICDLKILERVDPLVIENLAVRLRPFTLQTERCYFLAIVKILKKRGHLAGGPMTLKELADKWKSTLRDTTAPFPAGVKLPNVVPGRVAESMSGGRMQLAIGNVLLTGQQVIELLLYGELAHVDPDKERTLARIRKSGAAPAFEIAVIAVAAALAHLIGILRLYAEAFARALPEQLIADIESESEMP